MATLTTKLSIAGTGLTSNQLAINISDLLSVTTPHVGLSKESVATGSETVLVASSVSAARYVFVRNTDTVNYIVLKNDAGNIWGRLNAGECILYCVPPSTGFELQANTAACVIEYGYWTKL